MIIAIDGPAGSGKSTAARNLARRLGYLYVDTGAMYRAITLKAVKSGQDLDDPDALVRLCRRTTIELRQTGSGKLKIFLDGENVTEAIRDPGLTRAVFKIARQPALRRIMVNWQRRYGRDSDIVMEGRDIGTVVFPRADHKFFLDASVRERTRRRLAELRGKGLAVNARELEKEIRRRDEHDRRRRTGPLKKAGDAVYFDTTPFTAGQVVNRLLAMVKKNEKS